MKRYLWIGATLVGLLRFGYKYFDLVVIGARFNPAVPFVEEMTAVYGAALLIMGLVVLFRALGIDELTTGRRLAVHVIAALAFSIVHTTLNWGARVGIFAMFGRRYNYGDMPARYLMELPMDLIVYVLFAATLYGAGRLRAAREAELEGARLKGRLLEAELRSLRTQLEPHFLFNSLNTISSTMYHDPVAADEMIGHLSELLRSSLESSAQEVPLSVELESLEHYVSLLRARFGSRFTFDVQVEQGLDVMVPSLLLQPIVENSARHGAPQGEDIAVTVKIRNVDGSLEMVVLDNGKGMRPGDDPFEGGIGLGAARERLRLLYGDRFRFTASNAPGGGFQVVITVPLRTNEATSPKPLLVMT